MPTQTFMNLPKEKQDKILEAAFNEFSDVPFADASINQIVKNAGISRGSFYMYFEDKYDLLKHMMHTVRDKISMEFMTSNQSFSGDLMELMLSLHDYFFKMYEQENVKKFMRNIIVFFQGRPSEEIRRIQHEMPKMNEFENVFKLLDKSQFKSNDKASIIATLDIAFAIFKTVIFQATLKNLSMDESRKLLRNYLEIFRDGYKRGN